MESPELRSDSDKKQRRKESKILEICVDNVNSIRSAIAGGADRLELCSALTEGGLTPSYGLCSIAKSYCVERVKVYAMIRIRGGNFVYHQEELDAMIEDIKILKGAKVDGFVFGALTKDNKVDVEACKSIINAAKPLPVTFHRAFDEVVDPVKAMNYIQDLGFERILTSGQAPTAVEGAALIAELISKSGIKIMPGSGVNENNLADLVLKTKAREYHGSAKASLDEICIPESGVKPLVITSACRVKSMKQILKDSD